MAGYVTLNTPNDRIMLNLATDSSLTGLLTLKWDQKRYTPSATIDSQSFCSETRVADSDPEEIVFHESS